MKRQIPTRHSEFNLSTRRVGRSRGLEERPYASIGPAEAREAGAD
ncbi:hypothetical protein [Streptomyces sp. NPDC002845]